MAETQTWLESVCLYTEAPGIGVPPWLLEAGVSDTAVGLYVLLAHSADAGGGGRMPDIDTLQARLEAVAGGCTGCIVFGVGCALAELVGAGAATLSHPPGPGDRLAGLWCRLHHYPPDNLPPRAPRPPANAEDADTAGSAKGLTAVEADLDGCDGLRPVLQARARDELAAEGMPLTRAAVLQRAHTLLLLQQHAAQPPRPHSLDRNGGGLV